MRCEIILPLAASASDAKDAFFDDCKPCTRSVRQPLYLAGGSRIVGADQIIVARIAVAQGLCQSDRRPGTFQPSRVDLDRHDFGVSNGFLGDRIDRRTGTAPNPNSRRSPLIR